MAQCHESWNKVLPTGWSAVFGSPLPCTVGENCCAKTFASPKLRALVSSTLKRNLTDADVTQLVGNIRGLLQMTVNMAGSAVRTIQSTSCRPCVTSAWLHHTTATYQSPGRAA